MAQLIMKRGTCGVAAMLALGGAQSAAARVTVPAAVFGQIVMVQAGNEKTKSNHHAGTVTVSEHGETASGTVTSSISIKPSPALSTSASLSSGMGYAGGGGTTQMQYYFQVVGPAATMVPIIVTASGATADGLPQVDVASASAYVYPNMGSEVLLQEACCGSFNVALSMNVMSSTSAAMAAANAIQLQTSVAASVPYNGVTMDSPAASIATLISIAPGFAHSSRYRIVVSRQVGN